MWLVVFLTWIANCISRYSFDVCGIYLKWWLWLKKKKRLQILMRGTIKKIQMTAVPTLSTVGEIDNKRDRRTDRQTERQIGPGVWFCLPHAFFFPSSISWLCFISPSTVFDLRHRGCTKSKQTPDDLLNVRKQTRLFCFLFHFIAAVIDAICDSVYDTAGCESGTVFIIV